MARLELHHRYKASLDSIFKAFTQPKLLTRWFAPMNMSVPKVDLDLKVGGECCFTMKDSDGNEVTTRGRFLEIVPNKKLAFTWGWENSHEPVTTVSVSMRQQDGQTVVILTHEGFRNEEERNKHAAGWNDILGKLEDSLQRSPERKPTRKQRIKEKHKAKSREFKGRVKSITKQRIKRVA